MNTRRRAAAIELPDAPAPRRSAVSAYDLARRVLDDCAKSRAWQTSHAQANPAHARAQLRDAKKHGHTARHLDPPMTLRCSTIEALCHAVLGTAPEGQMALPGIEGAA